MNIYNRDYIKTFSKTDSSPKPKTGKGNDDKVDDDKVDVLDTPEHWLNPDLDHNDKCKPAKDCKGNGKCEAILKQTFSKPLMRLSSFSGLMGVDTDQYEELCLVCRAHFFDNFYNHVWKDKPEIKCSQGIFELKIKENAAQDRYNSARTRYETLLSDYMYRRGNISKEELESQKRHYENTKTLWEFSLRQLQEQLDENEARKKGYLIDLPDTADNLLDKLK
jgi:hypothetical protein